MPVADQILIFVCGAVVGVMVALGAWLADVVIAAWRSTAKAQVAPTTPAPIPAPEPQMVAVRHGAHW